jgi:hypothetical protein
MAKLCARTWWSVSTHSPIDTADGEECVLRLLSTGWRFYHGVVEDQCECCGRYNSLGDVWSMLLIKWSLPFFERGRNM